MKQGGIDSLVLQCSRFYDSHFFLCPCYAGTPSNLHLLCISISPTSPLSLSIIFPCKYKQLQSVYSRDHVFFFFLAAVGLTTYLRVIGPLLSTKHGATGAPEGD